MSDRLLAVLCTLVAAWLAVGCIEARHPDRADPEVLRVGVLPDEGEPQLRARYLPLVAYLQETTGLETELWVPESYAALTDEFAAGRVHLAWFGGLTFCRVRGLSGTEALVSRLEDVHFTTVFLVKGDAQGDSIESFAGQPMAFGPPLSTSGHLMARAFLMGREIEAEQFFSSVEHSAGHDETALQVRDGEVAIGAANSAIIESMFRSGRLARDEVRVLDVTPPYQNYVWATGREVQPEVRETLRDAFLALDPARDEHAAILAGLDATGFLPVGNQAFALLASAAGSIGLLENGP